jgi:Flp pilus assembly protein TadB
MMTDANPPRSSAGLKPIDVSSIAEAAPVRPATEWEYKAARVRSMERTLTCVVGGAVTIALALWGPTPLVWAMVGVLTAIAVSIMLLAVRTSDPNGFMKELRRVVHLAVGSTPDSDREVT